MCKKPHSCCDRKSTVSLWLESPYSFCFPAPQSLLLSHLSSDYIGFHLNTHVSEFLMDFESTEFSLFSMDTFVN